MPSCNLAETVHNKWLQAFENKGRYLYVAAVDDNDTSVRAWSGELMRCERESYEQGALKVHFRKFVSSKCFFI